MGPTDDSGEGDLNRSERVLRAKFSNIEIERLLSSSWKFPKNKGTYLILPNLSGTAGPLKSLQHSSTLEINRQAIATI